MTSEPRSPVWPHLIRSVVLLAPVLASLLFWAVGLGFSILAGLGMVGGSGGDPLGPGVTAGLTLIGLVGMAVFGLAWFVSLFVPVREVVAEEGRLIRDGAAAHAEVHDSIRAGLDRRCPPFTLRVDQLDGSPSLVLGGEGAHGLLVVRPIGPDVRVGWTVWRARSTSTLVVDLLAGRQGQDLALLDADACTTLRDLLRGAVEQAEREHAR